MPNNNVVSNCLNMQNNENNNEHYKEHTNFTKNILLWVPGYPVADIRIKKVEA